MEKKYSNMQWKVIEKAIFHYFWGFSSNFLNGNFSRFFIILAKLAKKSQKNDENW